MLEGAEDDDVDVGEPDTVPEVEKDKTETVFAANVRLNAVGDDMVN